MTIFVVAIGSLGIAGIPGTATMAASVGLSGVGMGAQVSPILAIDPIIDMPRTMINVTGSLTNALVVDKMMGNLNLDDYNDMSLNTLDSKANKESAEK